MRAKGTPNNGKNITNFVLQVLEKSVDGYVRFEDFTYHHYRYKYGIKELKKASLAQALKRLRENGLIDFTPDSKLAVRLTDQGKDRALWARLSQEAEKWDCKWRIVLWDIPEKRRLARDILRSKLKQLGFIGWQKSVWATKKDCAKELRAFIKQVGIGDWVKVLEANHLD